MRNAKLSCYTMQLKNKVMNTISLNITQLWDLSGKGRGIVHTLTLFWGEFFWNANANHVLISLERYNSGNSEKCVVASLQQVWSMMVKNGEQGKRTVCQKAQCFYSSDHLIWFYQISPAYSDNIYWWITNSISNLMLATTVNGNTEELQLKI